MIQFKFCFVVIFLVLFVSKSSSSSNVLSNTELASCRWLINQYGLNIQQDSSSICASSFFTCSSYHITEIKISATTITSDNVIIAPDPLLVFDFPQLILFSVNASLIQVYDATLNLLDRIENLSLLEIIIIDSDDSITKIPSNFPNGLLKLKSLEIYGDGVLNNDGPSSSLFALGSTSLETVIITPSLIQVTVDSSIAPLVALNHLSLHFGNQQIGQWKTIHFASLSFPNLEYLYLQAHNQSLIELHCDNINLLHLYLTETGSSRFNVSLGQSTFNMTKLSIDGAENNDSSQLFYPLLSSFTNLQLLSLENVIVSNLSQYPTQSMNTLQHLTLKSQNLSSFPTTIGESLLSMDLSNNQIQGTVPWQLFNKSQFKLNITNNTLITGDVPDSYCSNYIYMKRTSISRLPTCLWCYSRNPMVLETDLTIPIPFACPISINDVVLSIFGKGIIFGDNIGFGDVLAIDPRFNVTASIGNYQLGLIDSTPSYGPLTTMVIRLDKYYPEYIYTLDIIEIGVAVESVSTVQLRMGIVQLNIKLLNPNPTLTHSVKLNQTIQCLPVGPINNNELKCNVSSSLLKSGSIYSLIVSNQYLSSNQTLFNFTQLYPLVDQIESIDLSSKVGSKYRIEGSFGEYLESPSILFNDSSVSICSIESISSTVIECVLTVDCLGGLTSVFVNVDGFSSLPYQITMASLKDECTNTTNNCSNHGQCSSTGTCQCNTGYYSNDCSKVYPIVSSGSYDTNDKRKIRLYGDLGPNQNNVSIFLNNTIECLVVDVSQSNINCSIAQFPSDGLVSVQVSVDSGIPTMVNNLLLFISICPNGCSQNGICQPDDTCNCNTGYYSNNCSILYPTLINGEYDLIERKNISLYGDFSPFQNNIVITLNGTIGPCVVVSKSQEMIKCTLDQEPKDGLASVQVNIDGAINLQDLLIDFRTLVCKNDCYGHGTCVNGICNCLPGYQSFDSCLTKVSNGTRILQTNTTAPSIGDGTVKFNIEMVAILEIGIDSSYSIVKELLTKDWSYSVSKLNQTTIVDYQLESNSIVNVQSSISYSTEPRDLAFGPKTYRILPNATQLSITINNWQYSSTMSTLRVIFKTIVNNTQAIQYNCKPLVIEPFDQSLDGTQYLRIVRDNVQLTGRFMEYVLVDGRLSYSTTQEVNKTKIQGTLEQSTLFIGVNVPQCQQCTIGSDFTPLIIDKENDYTNCGPSIPIPNPNSSSNDDDNGNGNGNGNGNENKSSSNTWKIALGVSVGVASLVGLAIAGTIFGKRHFKRSRAVKQLESRLSALRSEIK
ncbi:EGF-like protein [Cavenderia fasciculata]|uniref:EGF-like protein n=1 Tax=Cavenderia fasciculata TaxID=261658 RepID=F4Q8N4_CACFS|nr:EGF-like protein [Cavenderia fasciculata]EGG15053.1 EGF-like protein [Cavenderia fasciculata]|eukprot:XP_004351773.1 EGF-like protein [Cavenderia fasciculata]